MLPSYMSIFDFTVNIMLESGILKWLLLLELKDHIVVMLVRERDKKVRDREQETLVRLKMIIIKVQMPGIGL